MCLPTERTTFIMATNFAGCRRVLMPSRGVHWIQRKTIRLEATANAAEPSRYLLLLVIMRFSAQPKPESI